MSIMTFSLEIGVTAAAATKIIIGAAARVVVVLLLTQSRPADSETAVKENAW